MKEIIKALFIEDSPDDIELMLIEAEKRNLQIDWKRIDQKNQLLEELKNDWDILISDYVLPGFSGPEVLQIVREQNDLIPIIIVSGTVGEDIAVNTLKLGANDYLMKNNLERLVPAIQRAISEYQIKIENKQILENIKKSEKEWQFTFHAVRNPLLLINEQGNVLKLNNAAKQFFEINNTDTTSKKIWEYLYKVYEKPEYCICEKVLISGKRVTQEITIDDKIVDIVGDPVFSPSGITDKAVLIIYDKTEEKRAELLQQIIYNISNAANIAIGLDELIETTKSELAKIIDVSNSYIAFYNEKDQTFDSPFRTDHNNNIKKWKAGKTLSAYVLKQNKSILITKNEIVEKEKKGELEVFGTIPEVWLGVPLRIKGKVHGVFAVQNYKNKKAYTKKDVEMLELVSNQMSISIERKRNEEELKKAYKKAMESDRLKTAFLANMSHEIRTPMNGIIGFTELLLEPDLSSEKKEAYISIVQKSGKRMLNTVNDIIKVSKIEAGIEFVDLTATNLNEQIKEVVDFFQPEANHKGLSILVENYFDEKNAAIQTDAGKFNSILTNLIKNAIKYTPSGNIKIGCSTNNSEIKIYVKDTGIGIPKNRCNAIFNRFEQADIVDSNVYEGSGLGLAISKSYVEMLGGNIWVESEIQKGSTFYFTMPFNKNPQIMETNTLKESDKQTPEKEPGDNKALKILVAEDDDVGYIYLETLLQSGNCEITRTTSGIETIDQCKNTPDFDIILMDIKMPGMDGYEATKKIREFNDQVVIIAQTAYALSGDEEKVLEAGCNAYISKPFTKGQLKETISEFIPVEW